MDVKSYLFNFFVFNSGIFESGNDVFCFVVLIVLYELLWSFREVNDL